MAKRLWKNFAIGGTALEAVPLNALEDDLEAATVALARDPSALFSGAVTVNADGAPTSASVVWPDGVAGVYSGTASSSFPGAVDSYTITRAVTPTKTYTQPTVTRNGSGFITNRPAITVT